MTRVVASGVVALPFTLNICAIGPDVDPISANVEDVDIDISFPASLTEGAVGKSIYQTGWAWWVVDRFYIEASASGEEMFAQYGDDLDPIRGTLLGAAQTATRRLLNSYRWRFGQANVHPVKIDTKLFDLDVVYDDGRRESLSEPLSSFFSDLASEEPPLESSINAETITVLQSDIQDGIEPPHTDLLELDLQWLESVGETRRADELRQLTIPCP